MKDLPRFSLALRAKTELEVKLPEIINIESIKCNAGWRKSNHTKHTIKEIVSLIPITKQSEAKIQFQKLRSLVCECFGYEEKQDVVEHAVLYIFWLLLESELLTNASRLDVRKIFGTIFDTKLNKMHDNVRAIFHLLEDFEIKDLKKAHKRKNVIKNNNLWGPNIYIRVKIAPQGKVLHLQDLAPIQAIQNPVASGFSMSWKNSSNVSDYCSHDNSLSNKITKDVEELLQLSESTGDFQLLHKVVQMLNSKSSNNELQNEIIELLGFEKFELVQSLLQHRTEIVSQINKYELQSKYNIQQQKSKDKNKSEVRPSVATSVIVQSFQEKELNKQNRRVEKKLQRLIQNQERCDSSEENNSRAVDALQLRMQQQRRFLEQAQQQPILKITKQSNSAYAKPVMYPYVFDNQLKSKEHAGFIGGSRIFLPDSATRIDNKQYEEVKIPATEPPPLQVGENRIKISDLDEIGRLSFANCTELNRIQSVVYPVAYHTNENMLVCAPTGAGKTNVAMLTIVHTIRLHIENGIINRDQFKIVYIAPMKALAAEMVENFSKRLKSLNIVVRELTGDMQLSKTEMAQTQILVTTPEKWDVVTRKGAGDATLTNVLKLLIIDEVHLLHGERGPVVETLVARTLRLVESSQSMIRIVGLSATLPNYIDVATFLGVNPMKGLFYFDSRFRPVPLDTNFIGVKSVKPLQQIADMDQICYQKCIEMVQQNHQVMVFVHARNSTARTATMLRELAQQNQSAAIFLANNADGFSLALREIQKSRNKQLVELFSNGFGIHHAGMLRSDRQMVEKYFAQGYIKVLVCTATLAWGVNLPAHAVIIKGTDIYDSKHGAFVDLGILDVLQIFGRAGRPQFDKTGVGSIITTYDKLNHYLSLLTNQFPIESNFVQCLADNLNAEIVLGTITNVSEAIEWLSYTYLYVRMRKNPHVYGIEYSELENDVTLLKKREQLILNAAISLDKARMIRFNVRTCDFNVTDLGRTASYFYIKYDTVEIFNELLKPFMSEADIFGMISRAQEFEQLKVRDDELDELDDLRHSYCKIKVLGGSENVFGKVNILMQTYLSHGFVKSFSLVSDMLYIVQNIVRISRALFSIVLRNNNAVLAGRMLEICKMFERQQWNFESPLRQFKCINAECITKLENIGFSLYTICEMQKNELKDLLRSQRYADQIFQCAREIPAIEVQASLQPITRTVLRIKVDITPYFNWNEKVHGKVCENFWLWIEDPETNFIYHSEHFQLTRKFVSYRKIHQLVMTIPLKEPLPPQYYIRVSSDTWLGSSIWLPLSFQHLVLPEHHPPLTDLLLLQPLPVSCLNNPQYEQLYTFSHFNPIQTQIFHCLYHTNNNVLLGAPTGSGKTIVAEIAMFRAFNVNPKGKVVYIAPLKALVKERINDWKRRFESLPLLKKVVELTGDTTPDIQAIHDAQIIVTTPEKWDGISRSWQTREYVKNVVLIVIDEIHLLGEDRGPVIEVIVSRTNFITSHTRQPIRIVGLSTALANAQDLANWLGITKIGLYNFKPSVRPVPLQVHINGFSGKHYCPRMATMNRPTFQAIRTYSPSEPTIIFVSSRRQTRLTALDLITFVAGEDNPKQFLHILEDEIQQILQNIKDSNLKFCLAFGIGLHHAGLQEQDRKVVEELFFNRKIQILVATATLAWGINLPAHLVVIKGTEYFDGKLKKYVDMPITDVLQMMGRAGRPQFDNEGVAVVLVHDVKKNFYKKFLYDPFPVESSLLHVLPEHINAEIVAGTVQTKQAALDYMSWTYFFRRLIRNPTYYNLEGIEPNQLNYFLSSLIEQVVSDLELAACITQKEGLLIPTFLGRIASYYYLSYRTMKHFLNNLKPEMSTREILLAISDSYEFDQQPVRHNEDKYNEELAKECRYQPISQSWDSPFTKTFILLQAHIMRLDLPNSDFLTDTKSTLDNATRVMQAMADYTAERGWLSPTLKMQQLMQSIIQARWFDESAFLTLPTVTNSTEMLFYNIYHNHKYLTLPVLKELCRNNYEILADALRQMFEEQEIEHIFEVVQNLPEVMVSLTLQGKHLGNAEAKRIVSTDSKSTQWIEIHPNEDYVLIVDINRLNAKRGAHNLMNIFCPKYPKSKSEAWFLTLGSQSNNELLAMKRVTIRGNRSINRICFQSTPRRGRQVLTLYLMSDCLIGLDQQFDLKFEIIDVKS
ncbi:activating signal cointegrator 1 complex subunit 3 [Teleopsis dalmanni]|uniref:activating signal cointegrator 1 complex subunit 3 n=1 Tax=Teleopsis dalmanni TaxID=139649 RepID=UPI0018CECC56|nr:activating signal cointegrator 1 complex subunit 3 [Teleopsis dalmanni]